MYRPLVGLASLVFLLGLIGFAGTASAATTKYTDAGSDHLWSSADNWSAGIPNATDPEWASMQTDGTVCIVQDGIDAEAKGVQVGVYSGNNEMQVTGGTITALWWDIGRGGNNASHVGSKAYVLMTGGVCNFTGVNLPNQWTDPMEVVIDGHLEMTGGTVNAEWMKIGHNDGIGHVDLHGGTIHSLGNFVIDPDGTLDITEGELIVDGNSPVDTIQGYIDSGWITAYGGAGCFELDYDERNAGQTILSAGIAVEGYDHDESGTIDVGDLACFFDNRLNNDPYICYGDFNDDGTVDLLDFAEFGSVWEGLL